jgi:hypothetical protein
LNALASTVVIAALTASCGPVCAQTRPAATADADAAPTPSASAAVIALQDVCVPLIKGGDLKHVVRGAALKLKDGQWILPISGKRQIDLQLPDHANPHVCTAVIVHRIGAEDAILRAVSDWAASQTPPLQPIKVQERSIGTTYQRTTSSWGRQTPTGAEGLVLAAEKTLAGKPVAGDADQTELMISITPA